MPGRFTFTIKIRGAGVQPETVPLSDLADILQHLSRAILETCKARGIEVGEGAALSLIDVEAGSDALFFSVIEPVLPVVSEISDAVFTSTLDPLPATAQGSLNKLSGTVVGRGWELGFVPDKALGISPAVISPERPIQLPQPVLIQGTTVLLGECVRIGGVEPKAMIRTKGGGPDLRGRDQEAGPRAGGSPVRDRLCRGLCPVAL
jgi:hypothetical protein